MPYVSQVIPIYRGPSLVEMPDKFVRIEQRGYPEWTLDTEYVLLLTWSDSLNGYQDAYGPNGTFKLAAGTKVVETPGSSPFARAQNARKVSDFLAEARSKAAAVR